MNTADPDIRERRQREADRAAERDPLWRALQPRKGIPHGGYVTHYPAVGEGKKR